MCDIRTFPKELAVLMLSRILTDFLECMPLRVAVMTLGLIKSLGESVGFIPQVKVVSDPGVPALLDEPDGNKPSLREVLTLPGTGGMPLAVSSSEHSRLELQNAHSASQPSPSLTTYR